MVSTNSTEDTRIRFDRSELEAKRFHSPREFAAYTGVSLSTVKLHLGSRIPYFKLGGRVLIDKAKAIAALQAATGRGK